VVNENALAEHFGLSMTKTLLAIAMKMTRFGLPWACHGVEHT
jgi:hypothetical protein